MTRLIAPALLALLLSGCGGGESKKAEGAGTAQGEVLPGSVSDAMIPLDQVKSQAPLAPKVESSAKADGKAEAPIAAAKPEAKSAAEPAEEPAAAEVSE
jgi:hypothetical protein